MAYVSLHVVNVYKHLRLLHEIKKKNPRKVILKKKKVISDNQK